jgi:hypothetical protein
MSTSSHTSCLRLFGILFVVAAAMSSALAHGIAGKRFFPTTLAIDDPFMSDEFSLLYSHTGRGRESMMSLSSYSVEWSKRIFPRFGISVGESYNSLMPGAGTSINGFDNIGLGVKYQFLTNDEHETILSVGVDGDLGGTGSRSLGTESSTILTPAVFFGRGLGDVSESLSFLRPLAITGLIGRTYSLHKGTSESPDMLVWGITLQYNLQYLQNYVKDIGLGAPFDRLILLAEFPLQTALDGTGQTSGTANVGATWFGKNFQIGAEVQIPVNARTKADQGTGVLLLVHFFIDDLFPQSIGRPIVE